MREITKESGKAINRDSAKVEQIILLTQLRKQDRNMAYQAMENLAYTHMQNSVGYRKTHTRARRHTYTKCANCLAASG